MSNFKIMDDEPQKENKEQEGNAVKDERVGQHEDKDENEGGAELQKCVQERDEYLKGWQRAKADFINYKKEELRRLSEVAQFGNEDLIKEIITVVHSFDLALRIMEKNGGADKGICLIRSQIEEVLKKRGLVKIPVSPGGEYDPSVAEAMLEVESDKPPGTVLEVMEPGYRLHGKVLKPAKVVLAKSKINSINN
ncbi:MAG: nucleotide exchange factor GrpE [Candidatus Liptonbacteria bacterium]|nr:nucleotide exchange factor GrpE [Candidatus Liptonbacteria bacterium]